MITDALRFSIVTRSASPLGKGAARVINSHTHK